MSIKKPIETLHLFPKLSEANINLLNGLDAKEWFNPSPIAGRTVKDLVSHLTDSSLRRLSIQRDNFSASSVHVKNESYTDLVNYIQQLNRDWMQATERISPAILLQLYRYAESELYTFLKTLKPHEQAIFSVQWAGEEKSENWFDIAREYTEKWHHQMQIRMALGKPLLTERKYIEPLYDTFMLGLPHHYHELTDYPEGETIEIKLTGSLSKSYYLQLKNRKWIFPESGPDNVQTQIRISSDEAWKPFTNTDRDKEKYKSEMEIDGRRELGLKLVDFVAVLS